MPIIMKKTVNGQPVKIRLTDGTLYSNLPIGFILPSFEDITPDGFLKMTDTLANRTVSRTTYKELFDWATARGLIGTGKPFGVGDGSTTFVIPDGKEIAFKGIGEYEGTVGNHVKTGGLANGEFIDDRLQTHQHQLNLVGSISYIGQSNVDGNYGNYKSGGATISNEVRANNITVGRKGDTTEVKSIGCHYYIKAKNIGVPADFITAMSEYTSYSTAEKFTGKYWIDGKPIYRKTVDCGTLPNATTKNVATGITNISNIISIKGIANTSDANTCVPIPYVSINSNDTSLNIACYYSNGNINLRTFIDMTVYTQSFVTIEYTKTTD